MKTVKKMLATVTAGLMCLLGTAGMLTQGREAVMAVSAADELSQGDIITYDGVMYEYRSMWGNDLGYGEGFAVIGFDDGVKDAVIPEEIDGVAVASWEWEKPCETLETVTLPSNIRQVGFWNYGYVYGTISDLYHLYPNLQGINIEDGNETYVSDDGVLYWSWTGDGDTQKWHMIIYPPAKMDASYTLPDLAGIISSEAFGADGSANLTPYKANPYLKDLYVTENNPYLTSYDGILYRVTDEGSVDVVACPPGKTSATLLENTTFIDRTAFESCQNLTSIVLPEGVESYGDFVGCINLLEIQVDSNNKNYCSVDGVLFNKEKSALICCPAGRKGTYEIPEGVAIIGSYAFRGCTSLTNIAISESVTEIGSYAFNGCTSLTGIVIPTSVASIRGGTFSGCTGLTSIVLPEGVTEIGGYAFDGCTGLISVIIPTSVTLIDWCAFAGCTSLPSITIPEGVTEIRDYVFNGCTNLLAIQVDSNNKNYCSTDRVLFNKEKSKLICCPAGRKGTYEVPESVTTIGNNAFVECAGLISITIPESVTSIEHSAFEGCTGLTDVYYAGTEEQWNAIEIGEYGNEVLATATIHFNAASAPTIIYGDVDENGELNIMDVILLNRNLMIGAEVSTQGLINADVDSNGTADAVDSLNILKAVVKLVTLPIA